MEPVPPNRDAPEPGREPAGLRADTAEIVADIDRIQHLVERIRMTLPTPDESSHLLHLLHVELAALS